MRRESAMFFRTVLVSALFCFWGVSAALAAEICSSASTEPHFVEVPDNATVTQTLEVPETGTITNIQVSMRLVHQRTRELVISLEAPDGTLVQLANESGTFNAGFNGDILFTKNAEQSVNSANALITGAWKPA